MKERLFLTLRDTEEVLEYDPASGVYMQGGEATIRDLTERLVEPTSNGFVEEVVGHIKRRTYVDRQKLDADPRLLVLGNGVLNVEDGSFREFSPKYLATVRLPVRYDPAQGCPEFLKFVGEVIHPEDAPLAQEIFGYCLWRDQPAQKAFLFVGEGGNGKSTLLGVLRALLGPENTSARTLQDLEVNRFAKADLYQKLANIAPDLPGTALRSTGTFKALTGGDPITAEHKFGRPFHFVNYAKLIFSANTVPAVDEEAIAFYRRWVFLVFPNQFADDRADRNLLGKLTTPGELSGIFNWALEGLQRLRANGFNFTNGRSAEETRSTYVRMSDPVAAFVEDCVIEESNGWVSKEGLFAAFSEYARENKLPNPGRDSFMKRVPAHIKVESVRRGPKGSQKHAFAGVLLKPKEKWGPLGEDEQEALRKELLEKLASGSGGGLGGGGQKTLDSGFDESRNTQAD